MAKLTDTYIEYPNISNTPSTPSSGQARIFIRNKGVWAVFDDGSVIPLTGGVVAALPL